MSVQAMSWVIGHSAHKGSELLCLLMLANRADEAGGAVYPSLQRLADDCRLTRRQIINLLHRLEASGAVTVRRRHRPEGDNDTNLITVVMSEAAPTTANKGKEKISLPSEKIAPGGEIATPGRPPDARQGGSEAGFTPVVKPASPKPSLEPSFSLSRAVADAIDGALTRFASRGYARDDRFLEALQTAYPQLNLELEALTMAEWLLEPRHAKRPCSKNFIRNWLKRAEADRLGQERDLAQRPAPLPLPWQQANGAPANGHYSQPPSSQRNPGPAPLREPTPEEEARSRAEKERVKQELEKRKLVGKYAGIGKAP